MKDEIKKILDYFRKYMNIDDCIKLSKIEDYITNLQEKLKVSQTNEETYRLEMQDITKCLGLKEDTIFDEVKEYATNLQEENKILKKNAEHNDKVVDKAKWNEMLYKSRNEKANEFIDNNTHYYSTIKHGEGFSIDLDEEVFCNTLSNILQGEDKDVKDKR